LSSDYIVTLLQRALIAVKTDSVHATGWVKNTQQWRVCSSRACPRAYRHYLSLSGGITLITAPPWSQSQSPRRQTAVRCS